ncbi:hypothetical protein RUND412_006419 [Rhizina undulata]
MTFRLFSVFHAHGKPSASPKWPINRKHKSRSRTEGEHFGMLVSLQMAVSDQSKRFREVDNQISAEDMLHGTNEGNLRKQGRLCLTFALKNYGDINPQTRINLANELESAIDAAYSQEDYRNRIYLIGGSLNSLRKDTETMAVAELPAWC